MTMEGLAEAIDEMLSSQFLNAAQRHGADKILRWGNVDAAEKEIDMIGHHWPDVDSHEAVRLVIIALFHLEDT